MVDLVVVDLVVVVMVSRSVGGISIGIGSCS